MNKNIKERVERLVSCTTRHYVKEWLPIRKAIDGDCVCKGILDNNYIVKGYVNSKNELYVDYIR